MAPQDSSQDTEKTERDLFFVMEHATALGFGFLAALLCSMRDIPDDVTLEFTTATVVGFAVGWIAGWLFWRFIRHLAAKGQK